MELCTQLLEGNVIYVQMNKLKKELLCGTSGWKCFAAIQTLYVTFYILHQHYFRKYLDPSALLPRLKFFSFPSLICLDAANQMTKQRQSRGCKGKY